MNHKHTPACDDDTCPDCRRRRARVMASLMWGGFYRCPNTGRILEQLHGDDKVLCGCRRSNPEVPTERTHLTGVHIVRFLRRATVDEYLDQEEARAR